MKKPKGWVRLGYIGDEQLPSYRGIISYTIKRIPFLTNQYFMDFVRDPFFFVAFSWKKTTHAKFWAGQVIYTKSILVEQTTPSSLLIQDGGSGIAESFKGVMAG